MFWPVAPADRIVRVRARGCHPTLRSRVVSRHFMARLQASLGSHILVDLIPDVMHPRPLPFRNFDMRVKLEEQPQAQKGQRALLP